MSLVLFLFQSIADICSMWLYSHNIGTLDWVESLDGLFGGKEGIVFYIPTD